MFTTPWGQTPALYPIVRGGQVAAVTFEELSEEEEQAMARYIMDLAKKMSDCTNTYG